jgi:hypothetical protein
MSAAYYSLRQNNLSVAVGSVDRERMVKAMADRMFTWLSYKESKVHGHDVGAGESLAESTPAHQLGLSEPVERNEGDDD